MEARRMNFVFVGSSPRAWGSEQHFIGLAKACHEAGHRVIAIVRADSEVAALLKLAGIDVRPTPFRGGEDPRAMYAAFKAIREIRADWLVTGHKKHYWALYVLARLTGTKLAVFRHLLYVRGWLTRTIFPRLVDRYFVMSDFALEALVATGAPRHRLTRLYNQIDLRQFRPNVARRAQMRSELNLPADAIVVGFVGRHEEGKGVRILRDALRLAMEVNPKLYALWTGSGPIWTETQSAVLTSENSHRHRFVEWSRTPEHIYAALDLLVAPSQAAETFGRVVAEAQACGVPVIASSAGGLVETFAAGRSGELFMGCDPADLAQQIIRFCDNEPMRNEFGIAGRRFVKQFDSEIIVREFVEELCRANDPLVPERSPALSMATAAEFPEAFDSEPSDSTAESDAPVATPSR
jgi:glycosyltransferase involved in cell wall biosynthesis